MLELVLKSSEYDYVINGVKYFTALVGRDDDKDVKAKQKRDHQTRYLEALASIKDLEVVTGRFAPVTKRGQLLDASGKKKKDTVKISTLEVKETDVSIGINIVYDCFIERL